MESDNEEEIKPLKRRKRKPQQTAKLTMSKGTPVKDEKQTLLPCKPSPSRLGIDVPESTNDTELSSSQEKELFRSSNNKALSQFFTVKNSPIPGRKYGVCPVCYIDLNFLHGISPTAHINYCLDADPEFEKGYCSGDSTCSLSNAKHFRDYKHAAKSSSCLQNESSDTESENEKQCFSVNPPLCQDDAKIIDDLNEKQTKNNEKEKQSSGSTENLTNIKPSTPKVMNKKLTQTSISVYFGGNININTNKEAQPNRHRESDDVKKYNSDSTVQTKRKPVLPKKKREQPKKQCPFYKKIPGTGITVDAFRYGEIPGCTAYFLTHFHSDHYGGLTKKFNGKLYCSDITANLVISQLHVEDSQIVRLPMYKATIVDDVEVTLLDANHCPGSVLFLLQLNTGQRVLHVGDFRADESMFSQNILTSIHTLYLDTTYCDPKYTFPPQKDVIDFVINTTKKYLSQNTKTLIVCGTYTIGKERVFKSLARALGLKIGVTKEKLKVLSCIEDKELLEILTLDYNEAQLHILPLGAFNLKKLREHLAKYKHKQFDRILAFKPTGWTFSSTITTLEDIKPLISPDVTTYGVPYSEHSSFAELKWFVETLKPKKIIPTVNIGTQKSKDAMDVHFKSWLH